MSIPCLITGATGFVGSHLSEACAARGFAVRALVRPGTPATLLEKLGGTVIRGDLTDAGSVREAVQGVEVVLNAAAKVGDWGPVDDYRAVNVEGLRNLLEACRAHPVKRFVHLSSLGVYAARDHYQTDEAEPLPAQHVDGYTQSKVEAEQLVLRYQREHGIPVVVLRPGFVYGPRDRTVLPKLVENLQAGAIRYLGSGQQAMNTIYVANLVDAVFLALDQPDCTGQIYNLTDGETVSKRRFLETICEGLDLPKPKGSVPLWLAKRIAWFLERQARRRGDPQAPRLTQGRLKFLGLNLDFSIEKAKRELGYQPRYNFDQGMSQSLAWYQTNVK